MFRSELESVPELEDGQLVDVFGAGGRFVGRGFFQSAGGIVARILTRHQEAIDRRFFEHRFEAARSLRERLFPGQDVYRWVFGESDGLPGLVADRYGEVVAARTQCAFYVPYAETLAEILLDHDDVKGAALEFCGKWQRFGEVPDPIEVEIEGLRLKADLEQGQKTGLFLDQRLNTRLLEALAPNTRVLDCHCYVGLWSCSAARFGAARVLGVDTSPAAIALARQNAAANEYNGACSFECADAAEALRRGDIYDVVILDPPALAKSREQRSKALGLYQALNRDAMKALAPGGYLITSCCSHFIEREAFFEALKRAARAARRQVLLLDVRGAPPDHPILMAMPETAYLTCAALRVI